MKKVFGLGYEVPAYWQAGVSIIGQAVMGKDAGIEASRQDPTTGSSNIQFLFTSLDTSFDNDKH